MSFIIFGSIPLIIYILIVATGKLIEINKQTTFYISIGVTGGTLFLMGIMKVRCFSKVFLR